MYPPDIGGIITRREQPAAHAGRVVVDVEDRPAGRGPLDLADQPSRLDPQTGLLAHLPHHGLGVALARPDPAARQRPAAHLRLVPPFDQ